NRRSAASKRKSSAASTAGKKSNGSAPTALCPIEHRLSPPTRYSRAMVNAIKRIVKPLIVVAVLCVVFAPAQASADGFLMPWVGSAFGSSFENGQPIFGVTAGAMGKGVIGGELDFGYSPSFFGTKTDFGNNTVMNVMVNLIIGAPIGGTQGKGLRPYVTAGTGLLRTQIDGGTVTDVSASNNM